MYKIIKYLRNIKNNNDILLIEDAKTGKQYLTTGVYNWDLTENRLKQCSSISKGNINWEAFNKRWNKYFQYSQLT